MPQTFQVLRCYKCSFFQVHHTNKSNKWECKLCGEKQSVKRYYGLGTAKECRSHVQKLNGMRGALDGMKNNTSHDSDSSNNEEIVTEPVKDNYKPVKNSKWSKYLEETKPVEENTNENMSLEGAEVVLEIPKKRRKQYTNNYKRNVSTVKHGQIHKNDITTPVIVPNPNTQIITTPVIVPNPNTQIIPVNTQSTFHYEYSIPEDPTNKYSKWDDFKVQEPFAPVYTDILTSSGNPDSKLTVPNQFLFSWSDEKDLANVIQI